MVLRTLALPVLAAALLAATAATASADTLVAAAPGARNLTANGGYQAWAAPAAGGRWRLTVRAPDGSVTTPAIADFGAPPGPQIGSTQFAAAGRRLLAVYSRCRGASALAGCDVYAYDLAAGTEEKIAKLASKTYSETAPSIELGRLAFVRRGGGPRPGLYYWSLGSSSAPRRLSTVLARETTTNSTRVAYTYNSSRGGGLAVRLLSGHGSVLVPVSRQPAVPRSPLLTRYNAAWLLQDGHVQATALRRLGRPLRAERRQRQPRAAGHHRQHRAQERPHERALLPGRRGREAHRSAALLDLGVELRGEVAVEVGLLPPDEAHAPR